MTKKILMVGVLDVPSSTNVAMKRGFEKLGYEVDIYNYRTIANILGSAGAMNKHFRYTLKGHKWELIVFCKVNGMDPSILHEAKAYGPTWYWFMDPMKTAKAMNAATYAQNATFASATSSEVCERFSLVNKNTCLMIEGYDPDAYYYEDLKKIHDILFVGNATPARVNEIYRLKGIGMRISIFGHGWPDSLNANHSVHMEDECTEINQSRWVLNLPQDEYIFSDRVMKTLGCGANVISLKCKDLEIFNGYVKTYGSESEFVKITKVPHNELYAKEVESMMKEDYSWKSVCADILERVKEEK